MSDETYADGLAVRRAVLGDAHVDRSLANATEFSGPWQDYVTTAAWGQVWSRPGLDRRTRSMLTLALLTALSHENELAMHVRAAVGNDVSADEIREVLLHTAVYAGVPAANSAFAVAQRVLAELGVEQATRPYSPTGHNPPDESAKDSASGPFAGPPDRIQGSPQGRP
jgi:4-carboxymuconolactone decarboxylase